MHGGRFVVAVVLCSLLASGAAWAEESAGEAAVAADSEADAPRERQSRHPGNQIPAARNGGILNAGELAYIGYIDGQLFPPAAMFSIQYGATYWLTLGVDVGGGLGVFQGLLHFRLENMPPVANHRFFWGGHVRTGYKRHVLDYGENLSFDDVSWILTYENSFSVRLGRDRRHILYLDTVFYADFDISENDYQTDLYLLPAVLGYEYVIGERGNFFIEAGLAYSFTGNETSRGVLFDDTFFAVFAIGFAYRRPGERTALGTF